MVTYSNAEKKIVESGADAIHKVLAGDDADAKERLCPTWIITLTHIIRTRCPMNQKS